MNCLHPWPKRTLWRSYQWEQNPHVPTTLHTDDWKHFLLTSWGSAHPRFVPFFACVLCRQLQQCVHNLTLLWSCTVVPHHHASHRGQRECPWSPPKTWLDGFPLRGSAWTTQTFLKLSFPSQLHQPNSGLWPLWHFWHNRKCDRKYIGRGHTNLTVTFIQTWCSCKQCRGPEACPLTKFTSADPDNHRLLGFSKNILSIPWSPLQLMQWSGLECTG